MGLANKLIKLLRDPLGILSRRWLSVSELFRFVTGGDYRVVDYWEHRHEKYGFDLRGVGDKTKSHEENVKLLEQGTEVFFETCLEVNVEFDIARVLDIGCGTGHFAEVLVRNGVKDYLGIDIVDTLFERLRVKFPGCRFQQLDVSMQPLSNTYDLILAMDILQHIVDEEKFSFALENIKSHISSTGSVIISTYIGSYRRESFYLVRRPFEVFQEAFPDFTASKPIMYADSFVFSLRRKQ